MFEAVEQAIQIQPVKHQTRTLTHGHELRPPHFIEGAALDAHVLHGFLVGEAAFWGHSFAIVSASAWWSLKPAAMKD